MHTTPSERPRRLRATPGLRRLARETRISPDSLVLPLFVREGRGVREDIASLPGQVRLSPDTVAEAVGAALEDGVGAFLLFGIPDAKDDTGSAAWAEDGVVQRAVREVKRRVPEAVVATDVCLCEYTDHGHCGVLAGGRVDNDRTLPLLARVAVSHARAGADLVAPSDMMDGRVAAIRAALDRDGLAETAIMSYAVKYASAFYGPFRDAAGSAPRNGDRRGYQMDWHNRREAGREARLDMAEGADIIMVKPALGYLDVLADVARLADRPVAAYSVSGEYAMFRAAAERGWLDEDAAVREAAAAVFRAGADILITYHARRLAVALRKGELG